MSATSPWNHMERAHGIVLPQLRGVIIGGGVMEVYTVSLPWILKSIDCLL